MIVNDEKGDDIMTMYEVSYMKDDVPHSNLAKASSEQAVKEWFSKNKPTVKNVYVHKANADSMRPGKPIIEVGK